MSRSVTKQPRIAIFGAGISGIAMGVRLKQGGFTNFEIFERESDVGGTWNNHRYPGLCCDNPAHLYSFSFDGNPDWSMPYPPRVEIAAYFRRVAENFDLIRHVRFNTPVKSATYDEARKEWEVTLDNGEVRVVDIVIGTLGPYNTAQFPAIPGIDAFQGESWHSSHWPEGVDLAGKTVAVVGSAASAVQIVPEVAKVADELHVFQRTPNWIFPRDVTPYSASQRATFRRYPILRKRLRWKYYRDQLAAMKALWGDKEKTKAMEDAGTAYLESVITDPELRQKLTPKYVLGCKRILITSDYYPAFNRDNVELVTDGIREITAEGVVSSSGEVRPVDVIIYCTGYLFPHFEGPVKVVGRGGRTLGEAFGAAPEAYAAGTSVPGFPNYFIVNGPNGVLGYSSATLSAEIESAYVLKLIKHLVSNKKKVLEPRADVTKKYNLATQEALSTTNFASTANCPSFYHDKNGRVAFFYRGSALKMWWELRRVNRKAYAIEA